MKKLMIMLCTLLAVGSADYVLAPPVTEGKAPETGKTGRSGSESGRPTEGKSQEPSKEYKAKSTADKQMMQLDPKTLQLPSNPPVKDVAAVFNLDEKPGDSVETMRSTKRGDGGKIIGYKLTRGNGIGEVYTAEVDQSGVVGRTTKAKNKYSISESYDPATHDSKGNPIETTPLRSENSFDMNQERQQPSNKQVSQERQQQVTNALESENPADIDAAAEGLVEDVAPKNTTPEEKATLTQKVVEFMKSGVKSVQAVSQMVVDYFSTGQYVNRSAQPEAAPAAQQGFSLANPGKDAIENYDQEAVQNVDTSSENLFTSEEFKSTGESGAGQGSPNSVVGVLDVDALHDSSTPQYDNVYTGDSNIGMSTSRLM